WVSRLEDPNQPIPTIPTLLILAKAFDVDLDVRFVPFSEMLNRLSRLRPEIHEIPRFEDDLFETTEQETKILQAPQRTSPILTDRRPPNMLPFTQAGNTRPLVTLEGTGVSKWRSEYPYALAAGGSDETLSRTSGQNSSVR